MIMNKIVTGTSPKDKLKQLAIEFISSGGEAKFHHWETVPFGKRVDVFGDIKTPSSVDYYIYTTAELPTKCKFYNEIKVSATCIAVKDGEDSFECEIESVGLTKKQLAAFIRQVKRYSIDYK